DAAPSPGGRPRPVLALPCGSRSTTRTRRPVAAKAVARLPAVVVLPTPPFWLAIAMMRARRAPAMARDSPSPLRFTGDLLQFKDDPPRVGATGMARRAHCPTPPRRGQFFPGAFSLQKKTNCMRRDKPLSHNEKPVERCAGAGGHDVDFVRRHRLDPGMVDRHRRTGDSRRLAQKGAFARVALDQLDPADAEDRQHQPGKARAAAEISEAPRAVRHMGEKLRRIEKMAAPDISQS